MSNIEIRTFVSPQFGQNAYLAWGVGSRKAIAIDPGGRAAAMADALAAEGLELEAVVLTHAHLDHVEGVTELVRRTGAPVWLHPADRQLYDHVPQQAAMFGLTAAPVPAPDRELEVGPLRLGGLDIEVRHVPGHAPGHVLLLVPAAGTAFVGDVVFQGSIGRTDLPGGDYQQLMASIREHVLTLPDDTVLLSGHGPPTTVGQERLGNPFLTPSYGGGLA